MAINADKLVKAYIKMRDARTALKTDYEVADNKIKAGMETIEKELLELCRSTGMDGLKTVHGTVSRTIQTRYWTSDWEAMHNFIKENDALDLLERRVAQKAMGDFLKENPDKMPVGMNVDSRYTVNVRRSTS